MERVGEFELRVPIDDDPTKAAVAGTFLADARSFYQDEERVTVKCICLPDFVAALGKPVKLLKMDIEGSEVAILNALLDRNQMALIELAIVETHDRFSENLARETEALRERLSAAGLTGKVRLDWL
jgi:FkbM family methyltransferase